MIGEKLKFFLDIDFFRYHIKRQIAVSDDPNA